MASELTTPLVQVASQADTLVAAQAFGRKRRCSELWWLAWCAVPAFWCHAGAAIAEKGAFSICVPGSFGPADGKAAPQAKPPCRRFAPLIQRMEPSLLELGLGTQRAIPGRCGPALSGKAVFFGSRSWVKQSLPQETGKWQEMAVKGSNIPGCDRV
ncbi:unnamed protein product [Symbiodinium natans]|uniref:Uncharacterized protein n=1 Tax=Symbiodinium natans TaxID=878477 RepID=A0A812SP81_9DINO|nr:unnamed protein product [Symbiodinium natans]